MADPNPVEAIHHVLDDKSFHFPGGAVWEIPQPLEPIGFEITKYKLMELAAAVLCVAIFIPLARRIRTGEAPRGHRWGFFETLLLFIRDQVARPAIGKHDADRFLPFLWTMFFFVLFCNLLGMVPWMGTATSSLSVTGVLAGITFATVLLAGMTKLGVAGFWKAQVPHMDLPGPLGVLLRPMIFVIEVMGLLIKHTVLAIRLLANMAAGHVVLGVILVLIAMTAYNVPLAAAGVAPVGVLGAVALSCLELFVAFLQAYIFTFLSALFIGMAVHPH